MSLFGFKSGSGIRGVVGPMATVAGRLKQSGAVDGLLLGPGVGEDTLGQACLTSDVITVLLPGPLPCGVDGLPESVLVFRLTRDGGETGTSEDILATRLALELAQGHREKPGGGDLLNLWREISPDPSWAPEWEQADKGSEVWDEALYDLLNGASLGEVPSDALWCRVLMEAETLGVSLVRGLELVLGHFLQAFSAYDGAPIQPAEALHSMAFLQAHYRTNDRPSHCVGAKYWNHKAIAANFSGPHAPVTFHETETQALAAAREENGRVLSWAASSSDELLRICRDQFIPLIRIEDGFLRSVGLGAGLAPGSSLGVEEEGAYYDPSRPSRLETLLRTYDLSAEDVRRGEALLQKILKARVSKYNVGRQAVIEVPSDREVVLVLGQVADDMAIRKSASSTIDCVNTENVNRDLLRLARERNAEAFILFKPHPDVETGLRKGGMSREETLNFADDIASDRDVIDCIEAADRVETFSSLSGFEALLRGKPVTVHGLPFYAGWGLSEDLTQAERRGRKRSLAEMVYLAYVAYPRYVDPISLVPCPPEVVIERLVEQRQDPWHERRATWLRRLSWLGRKIGL